MGCIITSPPTPKSINPACLDMRIVDCQFMSSHNTYISFLQIGSSSIVSAIKGTLDKGFRAIELDVVKNGFSFIVGHYYVDSGIRIPISSTVSLDECLDVIKLNAFKNRNEPLIISIEDNTGDINNNLIDYINSYLGEIAYTDFTMETFSNLKIRDVMGKILVITNRHLNNYPSSTDTTFIDFADRVVRVYPSFNIMSLFSSNDIVMLTHLRNGAHIVAINSNNEDEVYNQYIKYFGSYNIIPRIKSRHAVNINGNQLSFKCCLSKK